MELVDDDNSFGQTKQMTIAMMKLEPEFEKNNSISILLKTSKVLWEKKENSSLQTNKIYYRFSKNKTNFKMKKIEI